MSRRRRLLHFVSLFALLVFAGSSAAFGATERDRDSWREVQRTQDNGVVDSAAETGPQHGSSDGHLPAAKRNVKLLGRLDLTSTEGGIADVHYYKEHAYLAAWAPECPNGGVHVVDVSNPRNPVKVGFLPAGPHDYVGEGVHAIHVENEFFSGDILLVNHEACDLEGTEGISLWDITNPAAPVPLAQHVGDFDVFGPPFANSVHSVMGFTQDGGSRAYAVLVDNYEAGSTDVDIMDITNPVAPVLIAETGLPDWPAVEVDANGEESFHHDMWFRRIGGHDILAVSYWDAGWVFLNVDDPANPVFLYDTNYPDNDLLGFSPEGNAHQGDWNYNAEYFLGTDEDTSPFRSLFEILTGPNAGDYPGAEFGWTVPIAINFEDDKAEGTAVFGGSGCTEDVNANGTSDREEVPTAASYDAQYSEGEERIIVFTRGVCFFSDKIRSAELKGWDMAVIGNHHAGSGSGAFPDAYLCGSNGTPEYEPTISGGCTGHRAMHLIFGDSPEYGSEGFVGQDLPAIGTVGEDVRMTSQFDGWGPTHLIRFDTGEFVDTWAPGAALERDMAFGFGTLSVHEVETDKRPGVNLGYTAWYDAGLIVLQFGENGIRPVGVYRHRDGNDFWGISREQRGPNKRPLLYMSDRDSGLWIFKFTGCTVEDPCIERFSTDVTINHRHEFYGSVISERDACTRGREVVLYKLRGDGTRKVIGTDVTGWSGNWRIPTNNNDGRYTVEAPRTALAGGSTTTVCQSDRSAIIKVEPGPDL